MLKKIRELLGGRKPEGPARPQRQKLFFTDTPDVLYAIGDVHGCLDQLIRLEEIIAKDARSEPGEKVLVMLGDYVDRGPKSAGVIERLLARSLPGIQCYHLAGNHEEVMLNFLHDPRPDHEWLRFGGIQALQSYGIREIPADRQELEMTLQSHIPQRHVAFLAGLPSMVSFPDVCFVHGGIDPRTDLRHQMDEVLLWKRPGKGPSRYPYLLVHGHTPVERVEIADARINVDTGAYSSGILSAVKIRRSGEVFVVSCCK